MYARIHRFSILICGIFSFQLYAQTPSTPSVAVTLFKNVRVLSKRGSSHLP